MIASRALGFTVIAFIGGCGLILGIGPREDAPDSDASAPVDASKDDDRDAGDIVDADDADEPADAGGDARDAWVTERCNLSDPFGDTEAIGALNTSDNESGIRLSGDGRTAYFTRGPVALAGGWPHNDYADLYVSDIALDGSFGPARVLSPPSEAGPTSDRNPTVSADGRIMIFDSDRGRRTGWLSVRPDAAADFLPATYIPLMEQTIDFEPYLVPDARALYYVTDYMPDGSRGRYHAYRSRLSGVTEVTYDRVEIDGPDIGQRAPVVNANETTLYFAGLYADASTDADIYVTSVTSNGSRDISFGVPTRIDTLTSDGDDYPTYLTLDGCTLYFASNRSGNWDLYRARRTPRASASDR